MSVACILLKHLPYNLEVSRAPDLIRDKLIIFKEYGSRRTIFDNSPNLKIRLNVGLQEILYANKEIRLIEADLPFYNETFNYILERLAEWSPELESTELGLVYIGMDGLGKTFGTEQGLIHGLISSIPKNLYPQLGISNSKFNAYLAASKTKPGCTYRTSDDVKAFVAPFPVDVLPISSEIKRKLKRFGLDKLGEISKFPLGPIQSQFGPDGVRIWRLSNGIDESPITPLRQHNGISERLSFSMPTVNMASILFAIESLLGRLFLRDEMAGKYVSIAKIKSEIFRKLPWERRFVFKSPIGNKQNAYNIIRGQLNDNVLPGPLEDLELSLEGFTGDAGTQLSLFQHSRKDDRLREAIKQLSVIQGNNPIYRIREMEPWSRIPERRDALIPYVP